MNEHTRRFAAAVGAVLLLGLAAAEPALAQEGGGSAVFSVDLGTVVWTWVLFLITLGILAWKVFPMISGSLEERRRKIQGAIDSAREDREEARRLLQEHQRQLEEARQEAQEILQEGREAGERLREEILQEAGFTVITADNGVDALMLIEQQKPPVAVLDVALFQCPLDTEAEAPLQVSEVYRQFDERLCVEGVLRPDHDHVVHDEGRHGGADVDIVTARSQTQALLHVDAAIVAEIGIRQAGLGIQRV